MLSFQLVEQRFGILEIGSVKTLGKPRVDVSQQVVRLLPFPLLVPKPTQTHSSPQLQGFRLLAAGDVQSPLEPGFRLRRRCLRLPQEQDAPEATNFRFPPAFVMLLHQGVGLGQRLEALFRVAQVGSDVGQHGAIIGDEQSGPRGAVGGDPWRTSAIPASPWPCRTSAHPRKIVPAAPQKGKPFSVVSATAASACLCTAGTSRQHCET
jgi:hypothetical protein